MPQKINTEQTSLKTLLDQMYYKYGEQYISSDPVVVVRSFTDPADIEIMAFIVSVLAFGRAEQIIQAAVFCSRMMGNEPRKFVESVNPRNDRIRWELFYYRMIRGSDILRLLFALKRLLKQYRSVSNWFASHLREDDSRLIDAWSRAAAEIRAADEEHWKWEKSDGIGFTHLLPDPEKGGACKRPNLMLRWLVRSDAVDTGIWNLFPASKLIIPLDTHIHRIALNLGLTRRKDVSLVTAEDITDTLKQYDPLDPVKYDFALSRLGILKECARKFDPVKCRRCALSGHCRLK